MSMTENGLSRRYCGRCMRLHVYAFVAVAILLGVLDLTLSETRWFHWPVMIWGAFFCVHALYCKSASVDEEWADNRVTQIRLNSYDIGHVQKIEDSYKENLPPEESEAEERK